MQMLNLDVANRDSRNTMSTFTAMSLGRAADGQPTGILGIKYNQETTFGENPLTLQTFWWVLWASWWHLPTPLEGTVSGVQAEPFPESSTDMLEDLLSGLFQSGTD